MIHWRESEEICGVGESECGPQPRVSLGCSATLPKMLFPRPFFDLDMFSPRKYMSWSTHLTNCKPKVPMRKLSC